MLKRIVIGQDQAVPAGISYSNTHSVASIGARDLGSHATSVLGAVAGVAAGVAKSHLLPSAITTTSKLNGGPLRGARPAIMIATATETLAAPVPAPVLSLTSSTPAEPFSAACKTTDNTITADVTPLLLPSPETKSTAAPSRGRSTSPRVRGGRPPSPRRSPPSLSRSPSPQRSGTAVRTAAVDASSWSAAARLAPSRLGGDFTSAAVVKDATSKHGSRYAGTQDGLGTPPLTPASPVPSPAAAISAVSSSNNASFFGSSYGRDCDDGDPSTKGDEVTLPLLPASDVSRVIERVREVDECFPLTPRRTPTTPNMPPPPPLCRTPQQNRAPRVDVGFGNFHPVVDWGAPGDVRAAFIQNVVERQAATVGEACVLVRAARVALGGTAGGGVVSSPLRVGGILGEGSFGIVKGASLSFLPGEFALKTLKAGADDNARYCARVEMIAMSRLANTPHPNIIAAVAIDDRAAAVGMPILLPRANGDFEQALRHGGWTIPAKLSCLKQVTSGVRYMHKSGIGHGDLKPANILLFDDGDGGYVPKISDFGFSRALGEMRPKMMGTPGSMPLEVMQASVPTCPSQDAFAMGVMAFTVCVNPDKVQANMFLSPHLFTAAEAKAKKALEAQGSSPFAMAERDIFE
ncbi:unnamed protein product, partial [Ectocarpus fasciculatus]